jgi:uncharacterized phage infection (PIP) family protein YhgE
MRPDLVMEKPGIKSYEPSNKEAEMSGDEQKTKDIEELYKYRIAKDVTSDVEETLKRKYLWINVSGALAFLIVSWFGGSAMLSGFVRNRVDEAIKEQKTEFDSESREATRRSAETKQRLAQLDETAEELKSQEKRLADQLSDLKGQATDLFNASVTLRKNSEDIVLIKESLSNLPKLTEQIASIQNLVTSLASSRPDLSTQAAALKANNETINIQRSLANTNQTLAQKTVYIQFSGDVTRDQIHRVADLLKSNLSIRVPEPERRAFSVREVRYFYDDDKNLAEDLASKAVEALKQLGFGSVDIKVTPLGEFSKKPPTGTVELWLGALPKPSA